MHPYRTHTCGALRDTDAGKIVRLSGWIHRKRDHGQLLFIDLRDHYGLTQFVVDSSNPLFKVVEGLRLESVITVTGKVVERTPETINDKLPTGRIEVQLQELTVQSAAEPLPLQVNSDADAGEEIRLRYRFLDLRREKMQQNILLRSKVISSIRRRMIEQGFTEFQTPILTASSPEGARDFLVPSRMHPGKFYALPQAPQQFKQLLMVAGFDRYFQIAPCFRDEDSRADRSPGEFYQLDFEMSFVTQEDVFAAIEPVLHGVFEEFGGFRRPAKPDITPYPFPRIPYDESMLKYGNDKPDLRNPLVITDVTAVFERDDVEFKAFKSVIAKGGVVRAIRAPKCRRPSAQLLRQAERLGARAWARPASATSCSKPPAARAPSPSSCRKRRRRRSARPPAWKTATPCSSSATSRPRPPSWPASPAPRSAKSSTWSRRTPSASAGSSISRCTSATRKPARSTSATTRSRCPRAGWRRWKTRTR